VADLEEEVEDWRGKTRKANQTMEIYVR